MMTGGFMLVQQRTSVIKSQTIVTVAYYYYWYIYIIIIIIIAVVNIGEINLRFGFI